ncbi:MAG: fumarate reductase/succinate dehydrogenase flavoprotein subunit [Myxococcota bacterium]|jgi:succinate dehydrogenase / fumarate reductase flavoprotein subunit|nr:fumarate reductase/succinate dehydrogenase flavoprotein subunit [Myxococcota bacterium]
MSSILDSKVPEGPIEEKWDHHKQHIKVVNPANKRKFDIIVVGTGLAGASAAASLAELGYNVKSFCIHDSPRRAHSIAAQGGINSTKNYPNDGDSVWRLFYDTVKGGDFRSREANVYRLAQLSANIIDQAVAQGVPFAREYGGELANRSFGGALVSRTFYARGQTGQQLLLGAYQALMRQVDRGKVELYSRREMMDLVVVDGKARGIIVRNLITGEIEQYSAHAVVLASGGYGRVYFLSTNAWNSNGSAAWRAHRRGAFMANPCYVQIHPTCIPVAGEQQSKLTLMSESLRNDGRVWVPKDRHDSLDNIHNIDRKERDYYLERRYPTFGNLVPRDVASRNAKMMTDKGRGVGPGKDRLAVFLDFRDAIERLGENAISERYGNLFDIYHEITGDNPYKVPMRIYPAIHYTMGGLWVDYNLMSNLPGLYVLGEANFSDHGANRLGASALMQGLCDGYFVLPYTIGDYLASEELPPVSFDSDPFKEATDSVKKRIKRVLDPEGKRNKSKTRHTVLELYRELGLTMWDHVGMERDAKGLKEALEKIPEIEEKFWDTVFVPGSDSQFNKTLELALRVSDFFELGKLMARDALERDESAGGHFRSEHQTGEGEALRDDENFSYVAAWEWKGEGKQHTLHKEDLAFENVKLSQRSYK